MKRCNACGEEKRLDCFYPDTARPRGYMARCKECDCRVGRERYAKKIGRAPRPYGIGLTKKQNRCIDCGIAISPAAQAHCRSCLATLRSTRDERCRATGCTNRRGKWGRNGYCTKHYQQYVKPHRSRGHRSGYTKLEVFERDGGRCRYCEKRVGKTWHLAHLVALAKGGADTLDNVAVACPTCNLQDGTGRLPVQFHIST